MLLLALSSFLGWRLLVTGREVTELRAEMQKLQTARKADALAFALREQRYMEASSAAEEQLEVLDGMDFSGMSDADFCAALRSLRAKGGAGHAGAAGAAAP